MSLHRKKRMFVARCGTRYIRIIIAGPDPAIRPLRKNVFGKKMDARVKAQA
jgi:hypothetical protein